MYTSNIPSAILGVALLIIALFLLSSCDGNNEIVGPDPDPDPGPIVEPTMSVALSESSVTVVHEGTGTVTVSVTRGGGFSGAVALSLEETPEGVSAIFDPANVSAGEAESTLTLEVSTDASAGESELTIVAEGDGVANATAALELTIVEPASGDYSIILDPTSASVQQGETADVEIQLERDDFTGEVALSVSGAPDEVTATIDPEALTGEVATLTVEVGSDATPGSYTLTVTGQADGLDDRTAELELTVTEMDLGDYSITLDPTSLTLEQGETGEVAIQLQRTDFHGEVALSVSGAPEEVTVNIEPEFVTGDEATLTVEVGSGAAPDTYTLTVIGEAEGFDDRSAPLELTVDELVTIDSWELRNGDNHTGTFTHDGQLDEWTFTADQGDYIALSMARVDGNLQPWIRLFSPSGDLLQDERHRDVMQITMRAPESGIYKVIVGSKTFNPTTFLGTGDYLLRLAKVPGEFVVPDDDEGGPLTPGADHAGFISLGDLGMWTFTANEDDYIVLSMTRMDGNLNPWIRVVSPSGELLQDERTRLQAVQIDMNAPESGTYTVIVGSKTFNPTTFLGTGNYLLRLVHIQ